MSECQHVSENKCEFVLTIPCIVPASARAPSSLWSMHAQLRHEGLDVSMLRAIVSVSLEDTAIE